MLVDPKNERGKEKKEKKEEKKRRREKNSSQGERPMENSRKL